MEISTAQQSATHQRRAEAADHTMVAARKLEAQFLAEMLKATGLGEARGAFGGGVGEEHFASFIVLSHAEALANRGGIGLADLIAKSIEGAKNETL